MNEFEPCIAEWGEWADRCRERDVKITALRTKLKAMTERAEEAEGSIAYDKVTCLMTMNQGLSEEIRFLKQQLAAMREERNNLSADVLTLAAYVHSEDGVFCMENGTEYDTASGPTYNSLKQQLAEAQATVTAQQEHIKNRDIMLKTQGEQAAIAVKEYAGEVGRLREVVLECLTQMQRVIQSNRDEGNGLSIHRDYQRALDQARRALASEKETT